MQSVDPETKKDVAIKTLKSMYLDPSLVAIEVERLYNLSGIFTCPLKFLN